MRASASGRGRLPTCVVTMRLWRSVSSDMGSSVGGQCSTLDRRGASNSASGLIYDVISHNIAYTKLWDRKLGVFGPAGARRLDWPSRSPKFAGMNENRPKSSGDIAELLAIMRKLRDKNGGCPWDLEQDFSTIAPYTIEEAYEVASAIEAKDFGALKDELGDLLFQVVFHAQMASEDRLFDFTDVVRAICDKMIRRHPHVFAA